MRNYHSIPLWKDVTKEKWNDWHWQVANRIISIDDLRQVVNLTENEIKGVEKCLKSLRMAITPYYAILMDTDNPDCPIRRQAIPTVQELKKGPYDMTDPLYEDVDSPVRGLTHRYPNRVLFLITDQCAMYCRHCTRRRLAGATDKSRSKDEIETAISYIRRTPAIDDVILSGGDALLLLDDELESIIERLRAISHVKIVRIATRVPVTMPQRITDKLVNMLKKYHPLWLNTQFNHPREITPDSLQAVQKIADAGIPLGNQSVLLRGINDCPYIMRWLGQKLIEARVRPYYLYQCDLSNGIEHFRTSVNKGIEIIELLRGHTSGLAVPTYVLDVPGGGGKISLGPQYMISHLGTKVILRNYEGMIASYAEPKEPDRECTDCEFCARYRGQEYIGLHKIYEGETVRFEPRILKESSE